jgi:hypothetical protein
MGLDVDVGVSGDTHSDLSSGYLYSVSWVCSRTTTMSLYSWFIGKGIGLYGW